MSCARDNDAVIVEALEALPDGFAIMEADGKPSLVNSVARRRFPTFFNTLDAGASYKAALVASVLEAMPDATEEEREAVIEQSLRMYETGEPFEARGENGEIVRVTYQPMSGQRKVAISVNITELRLREEELKKMEQAALSASTAKSAFLARMSHEIRTPLNGVMGMAQVLQKSALNSEQRDQVATIMESGTSLMAILNDVLDLSKIEAGHVAIVKADADFEHLLRSLYRLWQPKAEDAGLELKISLDVGLPQILHFDALRVRQCISNLISNAIKFTAQGSVEVAVAWSKRPGHEHMVEVRVSDTGIGMDAQTAHRVFNPFEQADESTTRRYGGTGLGLSIVRQLAELMGGHASITSEPGFGSSVTFSFLAAEANGRQADSATGTPKNEGKARFIRDIRSLRVLLVDDHPLNRKVAKLYLEPFDMHIVEAINGEEALECLAAQEFDIVLLDMHMPIMDGPEAVKNIRASNASWRSVPIIALTADAMSGDRERYLQLGIDGYVAKPLVIGEVISEITRLRAMSPGNSNL